ncbi:MAG: ATP-dependent sacrificial sulfur transferase LarE [Thermoproteota archaeon]|nr:ATP-dependent sacrificial sulfur transferase LarE [Thermoproteota archaeon]
MPTDSEPSSLGAGNKLNESLDKKNIDEKEEQIPKSKKGLEIGTETKYKNSKQSTYDKDYKVGNGDRNRRDIREGSNFGNDKDKDKYKRLTNWFKVNARTGNNKVLVALSGGIDSAVVAMVAKNTLGAKNVLAVTANYQTLSSEELSTAIKVAEELEISHKIIEYNELENPNFIKNDSSRCYHCRNELAEHLISLANKENFKLIVDGGNADDLNDYRPGMVALHQKGIKSPLLETGFTKIEIRRLAENNKISIYDKPSNACLASRISKGIEITPLKLKRIENCETAVKEVCKVRQIRVRDHGDLARIEVEKEEMAKLFDMDKLSEIESRFKENGFRYVSIDISGYRKSGLVLTEDSSGAEDSKNPAKINNIQKKEK